jgi:hypothetical protein
MTHEFIINYAINFSIKLNRDDYPSHWTDLDIINFEKKQVRHGEHYLPHVISISSYQERPLNIEVTLTPVEEPKWNNYAIYYYSSLGKLCKFTADSIPAQDCSFWHLLRDHYTDRQAAEYVLMRLHTEFNPRDFLLIKE